MTLGVPIVRAINTDVLSPMANTALNTAVTANIEMRMNALERAARVATASRSVLETSAAASNQVDRDNIMASLIKAHLLNMTGRAMKTAGSNPMVAPGP
jgi:hypothetical protein